MKNDSIKIVLKLIQEKRILLVILWILLKSIWKLTQIIELKKLIKYKLKCMDCEKSFDSWFSSSKEFEKLKKESFLIVIFVTQKINKTLMAPNILGINKKSENKIKMKKNVIIKN